VDFWRAIGNLGPLIGTGLNLFIDKALSWLKMQRKDCGQNSDIWNLLFHWPKIKGDLMRQLVRGEYEFDPVQQYRFEDGIKHIFSAKDALVLKIMTLIIEPFVLNHVPRTCTHLKGHGGSKEAIRQIMSQNNDYRFFVKSDVKSYYASMDHEVLYQLCEKIIEDKTILRLIWRFLKHTITYGGLYWDNNKGIPLGCPLSPLLAALYLKPLDDEMAKLDVFYVRFMDDWTILAKTRWQLRKAIQIMNHTLNQLKVEKHPDKTDMGKIEKGFDFLGYHISPSTLSPAPKTIQQYLANISQLYEQSAPQKRIEQYQ